MRIFGGEQISGLMDRLALPEDQPIENKLVSRAIEQAQVKVEGFHFDARKHLVEEDDVVNQQREIIYKLRRRVLEAQDVKEEVLEKLRHQIDRILLISWPASPSGGPVDAPLPDYEKIVVNLLEIVPFDDTSKERVKKELEKLKNKEEITKLLIKVLEDVHTSREGQVGGEVMRQIEKFAYLGSIDHHWIEHIDTIDGLREGVRLRAYGQRDPLVEFKNEAFSLFEGLLDRIDGELARRIFRIGIMQRPPEIPLAQARENIDKTDLTGLAAKTAEETVTAGKPAFSGSSSSITNNQQPTTKRKIGRNDPCWCGSGKKWKKCHYPQYG